MLDMTLRSVCDTPGEQASGEGSAVATVARSPAERKADREAAREAKRDAQRDSDARKLEVAIELVEAQMAEGGDAPIIGRCTDALVKLLERKARLLGLDAPVLSEVSVTGVALDELDEMRKVAEANERASAGGLAHALVAVGTPS